MATQILELLRRPNEVFSILEIGANAHRNLERFLPHDVVTYLDSEQPAPDAFPPRLIHADACSIPVPDRHFDCAMALDVLEHIHQDRRANFICELTRVSKAYVFLAGPFDTPGVEAAEISAADFFEKLCGEPYRWFAEHREMGLPALAETIDVASGSARAVCHLSHGSLQLWEKLIRMHFLEVSRPQLIPSMKHLYEFYNRFVFDADYDEPVYRQFLLLDLETERARELDVPRKKDREKFEMLEQICAIPLGPLGELEDSHKQFEAINGLVDEQEKALSTLQRSLEEIRQSTSWRITQPIRTLIGLLSRR